MSDADDPSESGSDDNLEHDYETTEDEGQNDSSDNSYSDESDEECGTEMDAPETSISQDRHTINDREVNLDPDDDGSLPDLNDSQMFSGSAGGQKATSWPKGPSSLQGLEGELTVLYILVKSILINPSR